MLTNQSSESNNQSASSEEPEWEQERMSTLAGFEDKVPARTEETADDSESLLPVDPHLLQTEQSFQNHPFSKLGLVSISTLLLVVTAGTFLSGNLMQSSKQKPREQQGEPVAKKENEDKTDATDSQGRVLTDLALTTQGKELEALNEKEKDNQQPKTEQAPLPSSKPTTTKVERAPARTHTPPRPRPVTTYSSPRPVAYAPPKVYPPPRVYTPSQSIPKPVVQPNPVIQPRSEKSPAPIQELNPMEEWIAAAQLGSYGQLPSVKEAATEVDIARVQTPVEYAALTVSSKSKQQTEPQTPAINFDEETPILQEQPRQLLVPGTGAKAVLATPFAWDGSEDPQSDAKGTAKAERLSVVLKEPLPAADGTVALPAKTQLLVEARSLSESGLVRLVALAAIVQQDGQQYEVALPEDAIRIRGQEGKPLIAQKLNNQGREVRRRDVTRFAIGAIGRAAGLSNRPRSESVISNSGGFSRATQNDEPDLLAGILEGGTDAILDDIDKRNEEAISAIEQRPDVLFLKAGTHVEVFVNSSAAIDVFETDKPILESYQNESDQVELADSDTFSPYLWEPEASALMPPVVEEKQNLAFVNAE